MLTQRLRTATQYLWRSVRECARNVLALPERYRAIMDARETGGMTLLREWLSPVQRAQFDVLGLMGQSLPTHQWEITM